VAWANLDLAALYNNVNYIVRMVGTTQVMAVVKANGYGHGAVEVARVALEAGATRLGVAHVHEGIALRQAGIQVPVQVFRNFELGHINEYLNYNLEITLSSENAIRQLLSHPASEKPFPVHIKIDTGMNRLGLRAATFAKQAAELLRHRKLSILGIMTHFATADETDHEFLKSQLRCFKKIMDLPVLQGRDILYHAANTAATLKHPETWLNLVRTGIGMYGYPPTQEMAGTSPFKPVLSLHARLAQIKQILPGETVSYNRTWTALQPTFIGTVDIGYGDGYPRALSNKMQVLVNGRRAAIVGTVCMDMLMVDLGEQPQDQPGDEVVLLGKQGHDEIPIWDFCDHLGTIPYEITCMISQRVQRNYIER